MASGWKRSTIAEGFGQPAGTPSESGLPVGGTRYGPNTVDQLQRIAAGEPVLPPKATPRNEGAAPQTTQPPAPQLPAHGAGEQTILPATRLPVRSDLAALRAQRWFGPVDAIFRKAGISTFAWTHNALRKSGGNPNAVGAGGTSHGLFQLHEGGGELDPFIKKYGREHALRIARDPIQAATHLAKVARARGVHKIQDERRQAVEFTRRVEQPAQHLPAQKEQGLLGSRSTTGKLAPTPPPAGTQRQPATQDAGLQRIRGIQQRIGDLEQRVSATEPNKYRLKAEPVLAEEESLEVRSQELTGRLYDPSVAEAERRETFARLHGAPAGQPPAPGTINYRALQIRSHLGNLGVAERVAKVLFGQATEARLDQWLGSATKLRGLKQQRDTLKVEIGKRKAAVDAERRKLDALRARVAELERPRSVIEQVTGNVPDPREVNAFKARLLEATKTYEANYNQYLQRGSQARQLQKQIEALAPKVEQERARLLAEAEKAEWKAAKAQPSPSRASLLAQVSPQEIGLKRIQDPRHFNVARWSFGKPQEALVKFRGQTVVEKDAGRLVQQVAPGRQMSEDRIEQDFAGLQALGQFPKGPELKVGQEKQQLAEINAIKPFLDDYIHQQAQRLNTRLERIPKNPELEYSPYEPLPDYLPDEVKRRLEFQRGEARRLDIAREQAFAGYVHRLNPAAAIAYIEKKIGKNLTPDQQQAVAAHAAWKAYQYGRRNEVALATMGDLFIGGASEALAAAFAPWAVGGVRLLRRGLASTAQKTLARVPARVTRPATAVTQKTAAFKNRLTTAKTQALQKGQQVTAPLISPVVAAGEKLAQTRPGQVAIQSGRVLGQATGKAVKESLTLDENWAQNAIANGFQQAGTYAAAEENPDQQRLLIEGFSGLIGGAAVTPFFSLGVRALGAVGPRAWRLSRAGLDHLRRKTQQAIAANDPQVIAGALDAIGKGEVDGQPELPGYRDAANTDGTREAMPTRSTPETPAASIQLRAGKPGPAGEPLSEAPVQEPSSSQPAMGGKGTDSPLGVEQPAANATPRRTPGEAPESDLARARRGEVTGNRSNAPAPEGVPAKATGSRRSRPADGTDEASLTGTAAIATTRAAARTAGRTASSTQGIAPTTPGGSITSPGGPPSTSGAPPTGGPPRGAPPGAPGQPQPRTPTAPAQKPGAVGFSVPGGRRIPTAPRQGTGARTAPNASAPVVPTQQEVEREIDAVVERIRSGGRKGNASRSFTRAADLQRLKDLRQERQDLVRGRGGRFRVGEPVVGTQHNGKTEALVYDGMASATHAYVKDPQTGKRRAGTVPVERLHRTQSTGQGQTLRVPGSGASVGRRADLHARLDAAEAVARQKLAALRAARRGGKLASGLGGFNDLLEEAPHWIEIGAVQMARGLVEFDAWSRRMLEELGDELRATGRNVDELLREIWNASRKKYAEERRSNPARGSKNVEPDQKLDVAVGTKGESQDSAHPLQFKTKPAAAASGEGRRSPSPQRRGSGGVHDAWRQPGMPRVRWEWLGIRGAKQSERINEEILLPAIEDWRESMELDLSRMEIRLLPHGVKRRPYIDFSTDIVDDEPVFVHGFVNARSPRAIHLYNPTLEWDEIRKRMLRELSSARGSGLLSPQDFIGLVRAAPRSVEEYIASTLKHETGHSLLLETFGNHRRRRFAGWKRYMPDGLHGVIVSALKLAGAKTDDDAIAEAVAEDVRRWHTGFYSPLNSQTWLADAADPHGAWVRAGEVWKWLKDAHDRR